MRILVLGSHGCVGKSIVRYFTSKGHEVVPWDIKMGDEFDLRKPNVLDNVLPSVDFVCFLAFDVGGSKYNIHSVQYIENNLNILKNTFRSLSDFKKPFIHTTSMMSNMNNNAYAVMKRLSEIYTNIVGGVNVKLWNVYGDEPVTEKSHVIPDFISQAINSNRIQMRTAGKEERLFLHSDDFAAAFYYIFEHYNEFLGKEPVDISSKSWVTIKEIAEIVQAVTREVMGKEIDVIEGAYVDTFHNRKNEPIDTQLNSVWFPTISLKDGIRSILVAMLNA